MRMDCNKIITIKKQASYVIIQYQLNIQWYTWPTLVYFLYNVYCTFVKLCTVPSCSSLLQHDCNRCTGGPPQGSGSMNGQSAPTNAGLRGVQTAVEFCNYFVVKRFVTYCSMAIVLVVMSFSLYWCLALKTIVVFWAMYTLVTIIGATYQFIRAKFSLVVCPVHGCLKLAYSWCIPVDVVKAIRNSIVIVTIECIY